MEKLEELALALGGASLSLRASLWNEVEPTDTEWREVKEVAVEDAAEVEQRLDEMMEILKEVLPADLFYTLDAAVNDFVRVETEAAFAFGKTMGRLRFDREAWVDEFVRRADELGVRIGKQGRQKTATLADLAEEFGVSVRTARKRLEERRK